jgi:hypothetical protein
MRRGVGSTRTADHPWDKKYAEVSIILFYIYCHIKFKCDAKISLQLMTRYGPGKQACGARCNLLKRHE